MPNASTAKKPAAKPKTASQANKKPSTAAAKRGATKPRTAAKNATRTAAKTGTNAKKSAGANKPSPIKTEAALKAGAKVRATEFAQDQCKLSDYDIISDVLGSHKNLVKLYGTALCEIGCKDLRNVVTSKMTECAEARHVQNRAGTRSESQGSASAFLRLYQKYQKVKRFAVRFRTGKLQKILARVRAGIFLC